MAVASAQNVPLWDYWVAMEGSSMVNQGLTSDGFDPNIWAENPKINNGFPYLIANPPPK